MTGPLVLLVEDELAVRRLAAVVLRRAGYQVLEAGSVAEARATGEGNPRVDVAVLDVRLPDGVGTEVAAELVAADPGVGVVLTSGSDVSDEEVSPGVLFLLKPFTPAELLACVTRALAGPTVCRTEL